MEEGTDVKCVMVNYLCDKCDKGYMMPAQSSLIKGMVMPNTVPHKCDNKDCGHTAIFNKTYPYLDFRKIEKTEMMTE